ncbi:hypothetical protein K450DRAFT_232557 [Umbelopsis ramanniana AG]|uniref:Uncharacterized protein n=1 Tax=Umbelopsis ramanniana AG TaxID=1314678 RepID=A0AAD5HFQ1_UMBRA|nr:uncharacterized protein K450DRAFT_232557 [Umbelopsis ramanniana AG]KAI8581339.1 hypothetical protein K450DRAFT_232557 [Umbelopsis ramanniana AG]
MLISSSLGGFKLWWAISSHIMGKAWGNEGILVKKAAEAGVENSPGCIHVYLLLSASSLFHFVSFLFNFLFHSLN